tara:strand:- start:52 stop:348 length:297 start_codon:yes stop_codon:yes gene_type:complete
MTKQKEILDRVVELERKIDDIYDNKNIKKELLAITECVKRDLLVQQKKHYRYVVRKNLARKLIEEKNNKRIRRIELGFYFLTLTTLILSFSLFFFNGH